MSNEPVPLHRNHPASFHRVYRRDNDGVYDMSTQHTKGPWAVFKHYASDDPASRYASYRLVGTGQFETIAEVRHGHEEIDGDVDANAHLIAAAPDLLEALDGLARAVNTNELAAAMACHSVESFANVADALKPALAAIAKARGEA